MSAIEGVLHGREALPDGTVRRIGLSDLARPTAGWRLVCLGRDSLEARSWLAERSGLGHSAIAALMAEDTRPRAAGMDEGVLLILRGVSLDEAGALHDMVSVRLLIAGDTVIAVQRRRLETFDARIDALDRGDGAQSIGRFVLGLVEALRADAEPILDALERAVDEFELASLDSDAPPTARERGRLNSARHDAILMRRHMHPQAEALRSLAVMRPEWLTEKPLRAQIKEAADAFRRIGEDLDAVRARAVVVSDEAGLRVAEQTNRLVLRLSAISIVFLPLTFLTGLLGVNLAGIPWAEAPWAFAGFTAFVAAVGGAVVAFLKLRNLL